MLKCSLDVAVLKCALDVDLGAQGIMSYGWDNFRLLLTESITPESGGLQPTSNSIFGPEEAATHLTFGSYNIENFHISGKRPARIAQQIVEHLGFPAVLALQEIQVSDPVCFCWCPQGARRPIAPFLQCLRFECFMKADNVHDSKQLGLSWPPDFPTSWPFSAAFWIYRWRSHYA